MFSSSAMIFALFIVGVHVTVRLLQDANLGAITRELGDVKPSWAQFGMLPRFPASKS